MGQDIKYIITTEDLKVPINIIHLKEKNATIFPILIEDGDFERMSDFSKESSDNVADFFDFMLCDGYDLEYPTKRLLAFVQTSGLRSLAVICHREILDLAQNIGCSVLFIDDKIVDLSRLDYDPETQILENEVHKTLKAEISLGELIRNEDRYWSYEQAEDAYLLHLKNSH